MTYKNTLEKLKIWVDIIQKSILVLAGIEVVIVIIIGVASSNVYNNDYSVLWVSLLLILSILYLIITVIKIGYNKSFPSSIVEELNAKKELEVALSSIDRKDALNTYISNTIMALSTCKCNIPISNPDRDWRIDSDEDFIRGMKDLTQTFNNVLNVILDSSNSKFTTGIYSNFFRGVNQQNYPEENNGTFLLRDDFGLNDSGLIRDIMDNNTISGIGLEIQNGIKKSFNNGMFLKKTFENKNVKKVLMICSNVQNLENKKEQDGVLFILTENIKKLPDDLESVMRMFSNIVSHWLVLYQHEVIQRQAQFLGMDIEESEDSEDEVERGSGDNRSET